MKILIEVTQAHIDRARESLNGHSWQRSLQCPVARAFNACMHVVAPWSVGTDLATPERWLSETQILGHAVILPEEVQSFIARFDEDMSVEPFTFTCEIT